MVAKILGPEGFPRRQGAEIPVEFPGGGFEQPRVQTIGGHPVLLAKNLAPLLTTFLPWCDTEMGIERNECQPPRDDSGY